MSRPSCILYLALCLLCAWAPPLRAAPNEDRTLSPYFFIEDGNPAVDHLPLDRTTVDVSIHGAIAKVTVTQRYENGGKRPLDLRYVFPASTRAAVHGMTMAIGDQVIDAKVQEREQAERTFADAKKSGHTASLLEQERPNVFSMSVAHVMPGDRIDVTLRYTELIVPEEGTYELVFPTVVGPRYAGGSPPGSDDWVATPYHPEGTEGTAGFELSGVLSAPVALGNVASPSHALKMRRPNASTARFAVDGSSSQHAPRDFILRYRLAGSAIQSGLSLYEDGDDRYFMLVVEPPERVLPDAIPPREYVFVVDVSGSMYGFPLDTAKALLKNLVGELRPSDTFNVLLFSGGSELLSPESLGATPQNVARALAFIDAQHGGGGTEMLAALRRALSLSPASGLSRSFIVVTDGYVAADRDVMSYVGTHLGEANVFSFGIGTSVNRFLVEGLAKAGLGEPFVVTDPERAAETAEQFRRYVSAPVLTDVRVDTAGFDAYDLEPPSVPDVLAERPVVIHGKWRGEATGTIRLRGTTGGGIYAQSFDVGRVPPRAGEDSIRYAWARARLTRLSDGAFGEPSPDDRRAITEIGLSFNLLTRYTSFVAVSEAVRNPGARSVPVAQPLALPAGVSNLAVGMPLQGASEPGLLLVAALGSLLALAALGLKDRRPTRGAS